MPPMYSLTPHERPRLGLGMPTVVGLDQKKQYVSMGHAFGKWFSRFMQGARLRMGMVQRQNEALSSKLVIGICAQAENLWT
jgi:hypothetical protein